MAQVRQQIYWQNSPEIKFLQMYRVATMKCMLCFIQVLLAPEQDILQGSTWLKFLIQENLDIVHLAVPVKLTKAIENQMINAMGISFADFAIVSPHLAFQMVQIVVTIQTIIALNS